MMRQPFHIVVIADDITGAADTGAQFCPAVGPVHMANAGEGAFTVTGIHYAGLAVFTNSRNVDAATAAKRVRTAGETIRCLAPRVVYKKIDSCMRGNPGAEIDALMQVVGATAAFVAPAFPQQGRTTVDGIHQVNGVPVADTEIGRDPLCPIRESRLAVLLSSQSRMPAGHVDLACIESGAGAMVERVRLLLNQGCRQISFDAEQTVHLDAIAGLARDHFENVLLAGSAGLAASLAGILSRERLPHPSVGRPRIERWLFVCGSASRGLVDQVAALVGSTGWACLSLAPSVLTSGDGSTPCVAELIDAWWANSLILCIKPIPDAGPTERSEQVVRGLARVAAALITAKAPQGLFLSGGDTAEAVLHQVGVSALLIHEEILPGLVRGELVGGAFDGLPVVTKAGAFGATNTLNQLINSLK
jgi:uncharacterized protein YgbK (DUF1537 family)